MYQLEGTFRSTELSELNGSEGASHRKPAGRARLRSRRRGVWRPRFRAQREQPQLRIRPYIHAQTPRDLLTMALKRGGLSSRKTFASRERSYNCGWWRATRLRTSCVCAENGRRTRASLWERTERLAGQQRVGRHAGKRVGPLREARGHTGLGFSLAKRRGVVGGAADRLADHFQLLPCFPGTSVRPNQFDR